ncbi:hypothetical protein BY458DRAFT_550657 [Sporodiniella umbellata]|nr:hypothetical protein BY458DRAFT_550657 [Sporodiniella umbellata]
MTEGASNNELVFSFCRNDQEEELEKIIKDCDINTVDGTGNSGAHYAAKFGSIGCLELIVNSEESDLDIQNTLEGDTPLHLAVKHADQDHEMAAALVDLLLAGGANPDLQNRSRLTPIQLLGKKYDDIREMLETAAAAYTMDDNDLVQDDDDDDEEGSASEEE